MCVFRAHMCARGKLGAPPVMARSASAGLFSASDSRAVMMVHPAEGPSLGVAPAKAQQGEELVGRHERAAWECAGP